MSSIRVDFYLLPTSEPLIFVCHLIEKIYSREHQLFVFCQEKNQAESLDELLWTFKDECFIPHNLQGEGPLPPPPVQIGWQNEPCGFSDILLNLAPIIPPFYNRFQRVIEIIPNTDPAKSEGRVRYRDYQKHGCTLKTHQLAPTAKIF